MNRVVVAAGGLLLLSLAACTPDVALPSLTPPTTISTAPGGAIDPQDMAYECWGAPGEAAGGEIRFDDLTADLGLVEPLTGMRGHAAAWGDVNDDGSLDLVFGTFATASTDLYLERGATGPSPDRLLVRGEDGFESIDSFPQQFGRSSGIALVDLDRDRDLDLALSRNVNGRQEGAVTTVFENTAAGYVEKASGIDPELGGRSIGVLDIEGDGLLDLVIAEDPYRGGSTRVYRNIGSFSFQDVGEAIGFPSDVDGLGVATADVNNDGFTDLFIAGSNRLFIGTGSGFSEVEGAIAPWETFGPEDDVSGAAFADVNLDGFLDLVVGHHFNSTLSKGLEVPVRLYLNTTDIDGSDPTFEDVTAQAGLSGIPTKAPHVELADMDNDGLVDIVTSASAADGSMPAIFRNRGLSDGVPQFETPIGLGSAQYWVTAPTADFDSDGQLDLIAVEWDPSLPSVLFRNVSPAGHWLEVGVVDAVGGVGSRVEIFEAGGAGDRLKLLGSREISATVGYAAGVELNAHFGLGDHTTVDVVVTPPFDGEPTLLAAIAGDRRISVGGQC